MLDVAQQIATWEAGKQAFYSFCLLAQFTHLFYFYFVFLILLIDLNICLFY